uniref:Uncharacterized protein n=1 Tax=Cyprinus carpio TaxID=7962 RepID=A0A8C1MPU1_CYPCA
WSGLCEAGNSLSMSSFSELKCSICLDVFTDPVSTPCGHNFCKTCLNKCWDNNQTCSCPYCKETFKQRPDLKINTTLREIVDHYKKKSPEKKSVTFSEVLCDFCEERKLKALKSCLVCQSSYCETHLQPHFKVAGLKKHKLMDPVSNLEDYICQKHERPLELFCRDEQTCVCLSCAEVDHKNHNTVPLEEVNVQQMIQDRIKKIQDINHSAEVRKQRNTEKEKAARVELFTDLICSIERCQTEVLEMIELRQKATEKQDQELIEELEEEITELETRNTELDLESLNRTLTHLQNTLHEKLTQTGASIHDKINTQCSTQLFKYNLKWVMTQDIFFNERRLDNKTEGLAIIVWEVSLDVSLDPDTAHPNLVLSDDGKQVRHGDTEQKLPDKLQRFDTWKFYFEVQVQGKTDWTLGVVRESTDRKGKITLNPEDGCWTVNLKKGNEYFASADPFTSLCLSETRQRVGVFVDYEEGLVSFYDVESSSLIYSFTGQPFTDKLYPYFSPGFNNGGQNSAPLIITPVSYNN